MANREQGLSYVRLRKLVVSNRFLARLMRFTEDEWVLKGEVALNLRLDQYGRTTRDLDLSRRDTKEDAADHLLKAGSLDLGDYFTFTVERTTKLDVMREGHPFPTT